MSGWKTMPLAEACEKITDGTHHSPPIRSAGIPYVTAKHIKEDGPAFFSDPWFVGEDDHRAIFSRCDPRPGDVLYIKDGATTGIAAVNRYEFEFSMLSSLALLRPRKAVLTPEFLCHWLNAPLVRRRILGGMAGVAIRRLTLAKIKAVRVPLPPLHEQRRIAEILDKANALRAKRRAALAQLDALTQSIFLDMFGDPATNPKGWKLRRLDETCDVGSSRRVFVEELVTSGVPFYRGTEVGLLSEGLAVKPSLFIAREHFEKLRAQSGVPKTGDLLLPSICPDGRVYLVNDDKPFYFKDARVLWISVDRARINGVFLRHYLKHLFIANYSKIASGTTFAELKIVVLKSLGVPVAPLHLQQRFAAIVESIALQSARCRVQFTDLEALVASLQHRAFRGEL